MTNSLNGDGRKVRILDVSAFFPISHMEDRVACWNPSLRFVDDFDGRDRRVIRDRLEGEIELSFGRRTKV